MATKKTKPAEGEEREYTVTAWVHVGLCKTVRARSAEEAREKAEQLGVPGLCHQCDSAGDQHADSWTLNGLGDIPEDIEVEE